MALEARSPAAGLIHHSDQGVQYASGEYVDTLEEIGARISMAAVGNPYENAKVESFFRTLTDPEIGGGLPEGLPQLRGSTREQKRVHRGGLQQEAVALQPRISTTSRIRGDTRPESQIVDYGRRPGNGVHIKCTLRAAIQESNDTPGPDTINFNIGGTASVKTISPTSPLPPIKKAVTINGYTQPGASANNDCSSTNAVLKIELSGANAGPSANGLTITAADSTIKGLAINRFDGHGILVEGARATNNSIEGNYVGTDASGNINLGNGDDGTHIGANAGVYVKGAANNTVGGTAPASRNVISANSDSASTSRAQPRLTTR